MNDIKVAINYISSLSSAPDKRGAERGASLALLRNMLDDNSAIIDRHPSGAPFLPGYPDKVISISHSGDYIAISIGNSPQGIDIQIPSPKLNRVASRFISSDDAMPPSCSDPLLLLWTIKEAVYKAALTPGLPLHSIVILSIRQLSPADSLCSTLHQGMSDFTGSVPNPDDSLEYWISTILTPSGRFTATSRLSRDIAITLATPSSD